MTAASSQTPERMTVEECFALEESSDQRHEYHDGEVLAMSGAMPPHTRVSTRLAYLLVGGLEGSPCVPYSNELAVSAEASNRYLYPDATVVCGEMKHPEADRRGRTARNPRVRNGDGPKRGQPPFLKMNHDENLF